jgi:hypothetical protein
MLNFGVKNERILDGIRENVIESTNYKNGQKVSKTCYDNIGNRLETIYYSNGIIDFKQIFSQENGFPKSYANYSESGTLKSNGHYTLNNQGQILAKYHDGEMEEKYQYDNLGRINEIIYSNSGAKNIYKYDANNLAIQLLSVKGGINLFGGPKNQLTLFINDKFGNVVSYRTFNSDNNELIYSQENKINLQGDIVETIGKSSDNLVVDEISFNYEYDTKNNWIKKEVHNERRNVRFNQQRGLIYA